MAGYLIWYSFWSFLHRRECVQIASGCLNVIRISQLVSIVLFLLGIGLIITRRRRVPAVPIMSLSIIHNLQYYSEKCKGGFDMKNRHLGAGSWGTALAMVLAENQHEARLWGNNEAQIKEINERHTNEHFFTWGFL